MSDATKALKLLKYVELFVELYLDTDNGSADIHEIMWILENRYNLLTSDVDKIVELSKEVIDTTLETV